MTLDQIISVHDEIVSEVETQFPKPLTRREIISLNPKLSEVKPKKTKVYSVEEYLNGNFESFFSDIIAKSTFKE